MKYYIVALFDEKTYETILPIQRNMSRKFKGSRNSPCPFIPILSFDNNDIEHVDSIVKKIISPHKSFRIDALNSVSASESKKSINLKIDNKGYIVKIANELEDFLSLSGINVKRYNNLYVSLANCNYVPKDLKKQIVKLNFPELFDKDNILKLRIKKFEIWKTPLVKKVYSLKNYELKSF
ncbi:hypothetical protein [Clostridium sp. BJN0001]|uniref:hypothetical protein n=1 Tax=Clostridium sp. BJN0001 TaxID=2930219 RepID=UPI001FD311D3|nr:hypothetical protein [Clostridium sp. BJN0001]